MTARIAALAATFSLLSLIGPAFAVGGVPLVALPSPVSGGFAPLMAAPGAATVSGSSASATPPTSSGVGSGCAGATACAYAPPTKLALLPGSRALRVLPTAVSGTSGPPGPVSQKNCYQPKTCGDVTWQGGPVMHAPTMKLIFWLPNGTCPGTGSACTFDNNSIDACVPSWPCAAQRNNSGFETVIRTLFGAIGSSALYQILQQYGDAGGPPGPLSPFNSSSDAIVVTDPFPGARGSLLLPLTLSDLENEINTTISRAAWSASVNTEFVLFTPYSVYSCGVDYTASCPVESFLNFCAFHDDYRDGGSTVIFADMPDAGTGSCGAGSLATPNGDPFADAEVNVVAHEVFESISDPLGTAWWNQTSGYEIADECAWHFGPTALDGADVAPGGTYRAYVQYFWSNANGGCYLPPTATFRAKGLPSGATWSVDSGIPAFHASNTTSGLEGQIVALDNLPGPPPRPFPYSITPPRGFGLAKIVGPGGPTQTFATIADPTTFTLRFAPLETVWFNETGLPNGTAWSVELNPAGKSGGPPPQLGTAPALACGTVVDCVPMAMVYDPTHGEVFVANTVASWPLAGFVSVISATSRTPVATLELGGNPGSAALAFDAAHGAVYVAHSTAAYPYEAVSVLSDATNTFVANLSLAGPSRGIAYDPHLGEMFVTQAGSPLGPGTVLALNDTTNAVVAQFPLGAGALTYDPGSREMFMVGQNNVTVFDPANGMVVATVPLADPLNTPPAYDPALGEVFVTSGSTPSLTGEVFAINDTNHTVVASGAVGHVPDGVVYDPGTNQLFVANEGDATVTILVPSNLTVAATVTVGGGGHSAGPSPLTYDGSHGEVWVGWGWGEVGALNDTSHLLDAQIALVAPQSVKVPSGAALGFTVVKGRWKFLVQISTNTYRPVPRHGTLGVPAHSMTKAIRFKLVSEKVVFSRSGLPPGSLWGVNITGPMDMHLSGTTARLKVFLENGTYNYTLWNFTGEHPHPSAGALTVVAPGPALKIDIGYTTQVAPATIVSSGPSEFGALPTFGGVAVVGSRRER